MIQEFSDGRDRLFHSDVCRDTEGVSLKVFKTGSPKRGIRERCLKGFLIEFEPEDRVGFFFNSVCSGLVFRLRVW